MEAADVGILVLVFDCKQQQTRHMNGRWTIASSLSVYQFPHYSPLTHGQRCVFSGRKGSEANQLMRRLLRTHTLYVSRGIDTRTNQVS